MKKKISIITLILIIILLILLVIYLLFIKEKSFTITFDTDGAPNIAEISVKEKEQIKLPVNPKKDGYVFKGFIDSEGNPSGYTLKNEKCLSSNKYHATNKDGTWKCNSKTDYMYSQEDGLGGAFMWCVKTTSVTSSKVCPSGYTKDGNTCKKTQTINCTKN